MLKDIRDIIFKTIYINIQKILMVTRRENLDIELMKTSITLLNSVSSMFIELSFSLSFF